MLSAALLRRALLLWLGLFALAFVNGALREIGIKRVIGEPTAHQLSALTAFLIFSAYGWAVWPKTRIVTTADAWWVGALWLVLTILTETSVLNRWTSHLSWDQILQTYNLGRGELWPLVLVWVGLLPVVLRALLGPAKG